MYKFWPAFANKKRKSFKIHTIPTYSNPTTTKQNPTQTKVNGQDEIGKTNIIFYSFYVSSR